MIKEKKKRSKEESFPLRQHLSHFDKINRDFAKQTFDLKTSSEKYKNLYNNSPTLELTVVFPGFEIVDCNDTFIKKLQLKTKIQLLGENLSDVIDFDLKIWKNFIAKLKKEKKLHNENMQLSGKNETPLSVVLNAIPIKSKGKYKGSFFRLMWTDISSLRNMQEDLIEKKQFFEIMSELNTQGWWDWNLIDNEQMIISKGLKKHLGYKESEVPNSSSWWKERIHPKDLPCVLNCINEHLENGTPIDMSVRFISKSGDIIWYLCRGFALRNKNKEAYRLLGTTTDITAFKKHERELEKSNEELEQFAYVSSHDLQAPLRHVASFTELLAEKYSKMLDPETDKWVSSIQSSIISMKRMLEDLLKYSKIGHTEALNENIDLEIMLLDLREVLLSGFNDKKKNKIVSWSKLPTVNFNKVLLRQVFQNLIQNSLKFKKTGVESEIKISAVEKKNHWLFTVKDNGIGIEMEYAEKIFKVFSTLNSKDDFKGSGIGLSTCRKIIDMFGGKIWIESEKDKGTSFYFTVIKDTSLN